MRSGGRYAYAGMYRSRAAYRFTVEDSIYVDPEYVGRGCGQALLAALITACELGPWRQMVAVIGDSGNTASITLHERCGFHRVGTLASVGFKFGRWVDSVLMQRGLGTGSEPSSRGQNRFLVEKLCGRTVRAVRGFFADAQETPSQKIHSALKSTGALRADDDEIRGNEAGAGSGIGLHGAAGIGCRRTASAGLLSEAGPTFKIAAPAGSWSLIAYGDMRFTDPSNTKRHESGGAAGAGGQGCRREAGRTAAERRRSAERRGGQRLCSVSRGDGGVAQGGAEGVSGDGQP